MARLRYFGMDIDSSADKGDVEEVMQLSGQQVDSWRGSMTIKWLD